MALARRVAFALVLALPAAWASAHPLAPALLELRELGGGRVEVAWKTSLYRARGAELRPVLPSVCRERTPPVAAASGSGRIERWGVDCGPAGLAGESVEVLGLAANRIDALLRVELADGRVVRTVLRARDPVYRIPPRPDARGVIRSYGLLGFEHILGGLDHLLFVLGLFLLVPRPRPLLVTLTAFTLGHSVTLSLAALGVVDLPPAPLELGIAVSVLLLAVTLAGVRQGSVRSPSTPWLMAAGFGLLHGLGFAGALAQAGLPAGEIPLALLCFNLGIELGQVSFVLTLLAVQVAVRLWHPRLPAWSTWLPVYAMGSLAAFWCFERGMALLP